MEWTHHADAEIPLVTGRSLVAVAWSPYPLATALPHRLSLPPACGEAFPDGGREGNGGNRSARFLERRELGIETAPQPLGRDVWASGEIPASAMPDCVVPRTDCAVLDRSLNYVHRVAGSLLSGDCVAIAALSPAILIFEYTYQLKYFKFKI